MKFEEMTSVLSARYPLSSKEDITPLLQDMKNAVAFCEAAWYGRVHEDGKAEQLFGYISRALRLAQAAGVEVTSVDEHLHAWPLSREQLKHEVIDHVTALSDATKSVGDIFADVPNKWASYPAAHMHLIQAIQRAILLAGSLQLSSSSFEAWLRPTEQAAA